MAFSSFRSAGQSITVAAASILVVGFSTGASPQQRIIESNRVVVTLLGTGGPEPTQDRFGPATLVQAGGQNLLIDAGRGVTTRLYQLGISSGNGIDAVFLTHYHSDHVAGLPDLWMTGYMFGPFGSRVDPLRVWGPAEDKEGTGVFRLANGLSQAFADDVIIRQADEAISSLATTIEAHAFKPYGGTVFEQAGVKVIAFPVSHGDR